MTFEPRDLVTILVLVVLEGLLSGDNALVLAVIVQPLPRDQQAKALRYGLAGAFVLRILATYLAVRLSQWNWIGLLGGVYLVYLPLKHFLERSHPQPEPPSTGAAVRHFMGMSLFWIIVLKADWLDLIFAVDSILAAVAITKKTWVIIAGGIIGIAMMRLLTVQVLRLIRLYPRLIDGAYLVVLWVGVKLIWKYLHQVQPALVPWDIREDVAIGVAIVLFAVTFIWARAHPAALDADGEVIEAERLFNPTRRRDPEA